MAKYEQIADMDARSGAAEEEMERRGAQGPSQVRSEGGEMGRLCSRCGLEQPARRSRLCVPCRAEWETPARLAALRRRHTGHTGCLAPGRCGGDWPLCRTSPDLAAAMARSPRQA